MLRLAVSLAASLMMANAALAEDAAPAEVRMGILEYGTVAWELDTLTHNGYDAANGIALDIVPFAGEDATAIALQTGDVDVIVSDWLWVSRMRAEGEDFVFVPYSTAAAAIMVPQASELETLDDLVGARLGVAGGPLDKSWLLLQGMAANEHDIELAADNEISYGAPPLLSEMLRADRLDAVLTFWHYAARLEADGFRELIGTQQAAKALAAEGDVSMIGYVFRAEWGKANTEAVAGFLAAANDAKTKLGEDDAEWERLHQSGLIRDEAHVVAALRDRYRAGIPQRDPSDDRQDAALLYDLLAQIGGTDLVGRATEFDAGTYWDLTGGD